jgi:hypothetical protein
MHLGTLKLDMCQPEAEFETFSRKAWFRSLSCNQIAIEEHVLDTNAGEQLS